MLRYLWRGAFSALLHATLLTLQISPIENTVKVTGHLSAYGRLPTDITTKNRQKWGQIPEDITPYDVRIAVLDCGRVGEDAMLHTNAGSFRALVFDCAGLEDGGYDWMISGRYAAEADWYFWQQYPDLLGTTVTVEYGSLESLVSLRRLSQTVRSMLDKSIHTSKTLRNVPGANFVPFPYKRVPVLTGGYSEDHKAIDVKGGCGSAILAPFDGWVSRNGTDGWVGGLYSDGRPNTMITIVGSEFTMTLLHGRYRPELGRTERYVEEGDLLGYEDDIGNSSGCHSHVVLMKGGAVVNPSLWMK